MARPPRGPDQVWGWVILISIAVAVYNAVVQMLTLLLDVAIMLVGIYVACLMAIWLGERWECRQRPRPPPRPPLPGPGPPSPPSPPPPPPQRKQP